MRRLLPAGPTDPAVPDLPAVYAYPAAGVWLRGQMVTSADGAAVAAGRSEGLSGPADKRIFALTRALADVILVGAATVRAEGYLPPTVRAEYRPLRAGRPAPALAIVSASLDLDLGRPEYRAAGADPATRTVVLTSARTAREQAKRVSDLADVADVLVAGEDRADLGRAVDLLAARGHRRLLCEGGPRLLAQVAAAGRLDELCLTTAPLLLGGPAVRVLDGPELDPPARYGLVSLLEEDGFLFARYLRGVGR